MQAKRQTIQVSKYPSIQVSKYPGAEFDPRAVPDSYDAVCCADPQSSSYGPPMWTVLGGPFRCLPGSLLGSIVHAACMIRVWAVFQIICPWVMSWGGTIRVPYMKRVKGSLRVVLSCIIVLLLFTTNIPTL